MEAYAYVGIVDISLRLAVAFVISMQPYDRLVVYAALLLAVQIIVRIYYTVYCRLKLKSIRFKFCWNKKIIKELLGFMGWTTFNNMSIIACTQGVNLVLNMFFNPIVNAARAVSVQVENATKMLSINFNLALNPQIVKSYSKNDYDRFWGLIYRGSKFSFFILLVLAFPIVNHLPDLLTLWLGERMVPDYTVEFAEMLILIALVNALSDPLITAVSSNGNIKWFQIVSGLSLLMILPISGCLYRFLHQPILIFVVYLFMSLVVYLYRLWYCRKLLDLNIKEYVKEVWKRTLSMLVLAIVFHYAYVCYVQMSGLMMFMSMLIEFLIILFFVLLIGLNREEIIMIYSYVKKYIRKN